MQKELDQYFIERHPGGERAILVHMHLRHKAHADALDEFKELAIAAAVDPLLIITGQRQVPNSKYFVGSGKAHEIKAAVAMHKADVVLFNHELSPAQGRNLEALLDVRVLGRSELILDIFAQRARTFEGKLQVELAQLQHLSTRLVRGWAHLERQKGGIGLRGPGETQLETDRRLLGQRIKTIKKRLSKVVSQREQGRRGRKRAAIPTASLVGYTNAGKSTLFNRLAKDHVYVADQLFATLDPTLRHINLPQVGKVIVADTVGFIRHLPHDLVAAFRATLEETRQADLLLHVVDASQSERKATINDVRQVLDEIDAATVPQLLVYNKIDLNNHEPRIDRNAQGKPTRVWVSALKNIGIDLLQTAIAELLADTLIHLEWVLAPHESKLRATLYELGAVQAESINDDGQIVLKLEIGRHDYERLRAQRDITRFK